MQNKKAKILICAVLCVILIIPGTLGISAAPASKDIKLYPGGMLFGVKFITDGVLVVGFSDIDTAQGKKSPAYDAGLRAGDLITKINSEKVNGIQSIVNAVEKSEGKKLDISFVRNQDEQSISITPSLCAKENKYKTGMWIRDSGAGIGTVTYIDPSTCSFAGLGHGICDVDTGALMPILHGGVMKVTLSGISKGAIGTPGELRGHFDNSRVGEISKNTDCGVFGKLSALPDKLDEGPLPIATRDDVKVGDAYIKCTLTDNCVKKYDIEITAINKRDSDTKNFSIKITDPALIEASGGIVQGMSGSPIIQDGKLVGAVTHVMINDPTAGYGIFIENMLEAAEKIK